MNDILNLPAFFLSVLALVAIPGPDFMYIVGRAVAQGRRAGVVSALGICLGATGHLLAAALGLSGFLAASPEAFLVLKYLGAAYLIHLGAQSCRSPGRLPGPVAESMPRRRDRDLFLQGLLTDVLNPKVSLFFLAFLPQFISPHAQDKIGVFLLLGAVVMAIVLVWDLGLALCADALTRRLRGGRPGRAANRLLGGLLVGLGLMLACEEP